MTMVGIGIANTLLVGGILLKIFQHTRDEPTFCVSWSIINQNQATKLNDIGFLPSEFLPRGGG